MIPNKDKIYTYKDYLTFANDERIEIVEGELFNMSPAPARIHQKLISKLSQVLQNYIDSNNGECEVYVAPFDVILKTDDEEAINSKSVVQPDISVICDKNKLTDSGCTGSPDMIIEIVSPSNSSHDYITKLNLYQKYKVKEYWIIDPRVKKTYVYKLGENEFYDMVNSYTFQDKVKVNIYDDLEIDFSTFNL
ncbi:MAG: Uma2 family endonuclease [Clostridium sp.]|nr:Uma2 family endonuclease [Clostridium sp.]MCI7443169.1 Uma2 family endonuclease [Clostridium sp.]